MTNLAQRLLELKATAFDLAVEREQLLAAAELRTQRITAVRREIEQCTAMLVAPPPALEPDQCQTSPT